MKRKLLTAIFLALAVVFALPQPVLADNTPDFAGFCQSLGKGEPYTQGRDQYCRNYSLIISPSEVCRWQNGKNSQAVSNNYLDPSSWRCEGKTSPKPAFTSSGITVKEPHRVGLDIYRFCVAQGHGEPYTKGRDWFCKDYSLILSMDEVCRWQNGSQSHAVSDNYLDPFSWQCQD